MNYNYKRQKDPFKEQLQKIPSKLLQHVIYVSLTWLDTSGLKKIPQGLGVIVLVLQSVANIVPQLGIVLVHLKRHSAAYYNN